MSCEYKPCQEDFKNPGPKGCDATLSSGIPNLSYYCTLSHNHEGEHHACCGHVVSAPEANSEGFLNWEDKGDDENE